MGFDEQPIGPAVSAHNVSCVVPTIGPQVVHHLFAIFRRSTDDPVSRCLPVKPKLEIAGFEKNADWNRLEARPRDGSNRAND